MYFSEESVIHLQQTLNLNCPLPGSLCGKDGELDQNITSYIEVTKAMTRSSSMEFELTLLGPRRVDSHFLGTPFIKNNDKVS